MHTITIMNSCPPWQLASAPLPESMQWYNASTETKKLGESRKTQAYLVMAAGYTFFETIKVLPQNYAAPIVAIQLIAQCTLSCVYIIISLYRIIFPPAILLEKTEDPQPLLVKGTFNQFENLKPGQSRSVCTAAALSFVLHRLKGNQVTEETIDQITLEGQTEFPRIKEIAEFLAILNYCKKNRPDLLGDSENRLPAVNQLLTALKDDTTHQFLLGDSGDKAITWIRDTLATDAIKLEMEIDLILNIKLAIIDPSQHPSSELDALLVTEDRDEKKNTLRTNEHLRNEINQLSGVTYSLSTHDALMGNYAPLSIDSSCTRDAQQLGENVFRDTIALIQATLDDNEKKGATIHCRGLTLALCISKNYIEIYDSHGNTNFSNSAYCLHETELDAACDKLNLIFPSRAESDTFIIYPLKLE